MRDLAVCSLILSPSSAYPSTSTRSAPTSTGPPRSGARQDISRKWKFRSSLGTANPKKRPRSCVGGSNRSLMIPFRDFPGRGRSRLLRRRSRGPRMLLLVLLFGTQSKRLSILLTSRRCSCPLYHIYTSHHFRPEEALAAVASPVALLRPPQSLTSAPVEQEILEIPPLLASLSQ
ncbi:hypothetical protein K402DRAFT_193326 [Aulographum hederae CBS 113979]|uniref:Uncharacterized protein n=1 Tax=Aulographum hederae CBS 113979 TaxID=1176131 RepID=A0A6G1GNZ1_9PEZI|nr:hypothetical protein K402DRAFT_193326 [Aulographum hederae CBS 113979]